MSVIAVLIGLCAQMMAAQAKEINAEFQLTLTGAQDIDAGNAAVRLILKYPGAALFEKFDRDVKFSKASGDSVSVNFGKTVTDNAVSVSISGVLAEEAGVSFYIPVKINKFSESSRYDIIPLSADIEKRRVDALRRSYPFSAYRCDQRIEPAEVVDVALGLRTLLHSEATYLSGLDNNEGWACLFEFLETNAYRIPRFAPDQTFEFVRTLSDYRVQNGASLDDFFVKRYIDILNVIINLNVSGIEIEDDLLLGRHISSELSGLFQQNTEISFLRGASTFEVLRQVANEKLCLRLAETLFDNISGETVQFIGRNRRGANSAYTGLIAAMTKAADCGFILASRSGSVPIDKLNQTARWLKSEQRSFVLAYQRLYDRLADANVLLSIGDTEGSQTARLTQYYDAFRKARDGS